MRQTTIRLLLGLCLALTFSAAAFCADSNRRRNHRQSAGYSGALIPGVEVTISSPSMIGGTRSAVTDEQGSYRFTELVPGVYRVTFALPGFKTLNIDGVPVAAGATRTINGTTGSGLGRRRSHRHQCGSDDRPRSGDGRRELGPAEARRTAVRTQHQESDHDDSRSVPDLL